MVRDGQTIDTFQHAPWVRPVPIPIAIRPPCRSAAAMPRASCRPSVRARGDAHRRCRREYGVARARRAETIDDEGAKPADPCARVAAANRRESPRPDGRRRRVDRLDARRATSAPRVPRACARREGLSVMSPTPCPCRSPNRTPHRRTHRGELEPAQGPLAAWLTAWNAMRNWMQSTHADVYFLQEAMARRMPRPCSRPASAHRWTTRSTTSGTARPPRSRMRSTGRSRSGRTCSSRRGGTAMRSCHRIRSTSAAAGTSPRTVSSGAAC